MKLYNLNAENCGGIECISACSKCLGELPLKAKAKWHLSQEDGFAHDTCDLCEMNEGLFPHRAAQLVRAGLL